jgi:hypothetical protein
MHWNIRAYVYTGWPTGLPYIIRELTDVKSEPVNTDLQLFFHKKLVTCQAIYMFNLNNKWENKRKKMRNKNERNKITNSTQTMQNLRYDIQSRSRSWEYLERPVNHSLRGEQTLMTGCATFVTWTHILGLTQTHLYLSHEISYFLTRSVPQKWITSAF